MMLLLIIAVSFREDAAVVRENIDESAPRHAEVIWDRGLADDFIRWAIAADNGEEVQLRPETILVVLMIERSKRGWLRRSAELRLARAYLRILGSIPWTWSLGEAQISVIDAGQVCAGGTPEMKQDYAKILGILSDPKASVDCAAKVMKHDKAEVIPEFYSVPPDEMFEAVVSLYAGWGYPPRGDDLDHIFHLRVAQELKKRWLKAFTRCPPEEATQGTCPRGWPFRSD
ncbi:MAG: hypothetical protein ACT4P5_17645 [Armatimonadota bacterium]